MTALLKHVAAIVAFSVTAFGVESQNLIDLTYGTGAGDFELGTNLVEGLPAGATNLVGWVVDRDTIDSISGTFANPSSGLRAIDLNGFPQTSGAIHTTIPTTPGEVYEVGYDVAGFVHFLSPSTIKLAEVSAGNVTNIVAVTGPTIEAAPIALSWVRQCFRFTALSSNSTVAFKSLMPTDASGVLLDNVSVTHMSNTVSLVTLRTGINSLGLSRPRVRPLLAEVEQAIHSLEQLSRKLERRADPAAAAELLGWINQLIGPKE
jgi:hypothetical protein